MTQSPTGGPAQTIHQVTSRQGVIGRDAQRVVIVTDGRPAEGGPQQAAYFVSDAEIAAGEFIVTGNKPLPIVTVGAAGAEYPPIAVYDVTGQPDDVQPIQDPIGDKLRLDVKAYWKMDEANGTRIDATGRGNDLTQTNSVLGITGIVGNAARCFHLGDSDDDPHFLSINHNDDVSIGNHSITFATWIKMREPFRGDFAFLSKQVPGTDEYLLYPEQSQGYRVFIGFGSSYVRASLFGPVVADQWMFIVSSFDISTKIVSIQINGTGIDSQSFPEMPIPSGTSPFRIGADNAERGSNIDVDETAIFHRILTQYEIDYLYNGGAGRALFPAP